MSKRLSWGILIGLLVILISAFFWRNSFSAGNPSDPIGQAELRLDYQAAPDLVVFARNYPANTGWGNYVTADPSLRLGDAYGLAHPQWWVDLKTKFKFDARDDLPLLFSQLRRSPDGKQRLVVLQMSHAFTGDGYASPGPELYISAFVLDDKAREVVFKKRNDFDLGGLQDFYLTAGQADPVDQSHLTIHGKIKTAMGDLMPVTVEASLQKNGSLKYKKNMGGS